MLRTIQIIAACLLLTSTIVIGQQKIGDNTLILDPASLLELESTSQGFLPSRLSSIQRDAQTEWDEGHIIYNTTDACLQIYNGKLWECFAQGVQIDSTIYKYSGTLSSNRVITMDGNTLTFDGSGGDVVITDAGFLGIGDPTPEAKLDVEGGTVRFSDYGSGTNSGTESYLLGVDSDGDVIEISPAIDTFLITDDTLKISLKGDREAFKFIDLNPYLDNTNIYSDDGTLAGNRIVTLSGSTLTFDGSGAGDVVIQADGDMGLGLSNPLADLHILGAGGSATMLFSTTNTGSTATDGLYIGVTNVDQRAWVWNYENTDLRFGTNNQTKFILKPTGQTQLLDYGSSTFLDASPANLLAVQADGDIVETPLSSVGTDDQTIDVLSYSSGTLSVSLENDGEATQTVDISGVNTDDQVIDSIALTGTNLEISLESDGEVLKVVDLSSLQDGTGTDDQKIDVLTYGGGTLSISLEGDAEATQTVNISGVDTDTDDQTIDVLSYSSGTLSISLEDDGEVTQTVDISGVDTDTDDQTIDQFDLSGTTLRLSLEDDGAALSTVDLSSLQDGTGTDDQTIDQFDLSGNTLRLSLEDDGSAPSSVDLTAILGNADNIYNTDGTLDADRVVTLDGNSLTFDGTGTGDVIIAADGDVGIGTTTPSSKLHVSGGVSSAELIIEADTDNSGESDQPKLTLSQDGGAVTGHVGFTGSTNNLRIANAYVNNGADIDFQTSGSTRMTIEGDGDVGIGTTSPGAKLEVAGGSVIFDDYGVGTHNDTSASYNLVVDANGAIKEMNTAKNARWFYAPAVTIDASATVVDATIDLYQEYADQFSSPDVRSTGAPTTLPIYQKTDMYYYVTFADDTVIDNITINASGVMEYDIIDVPFDNYTIVNVIFLIK